MLGVLLLNVITKQSLLSISLLCAIPSLQLYIALVGFALTTTRAHCKQGQTDASASQGTRVSNDNLSANSIHIHWSFEPDHFCSQYSYIQNAESDPDFFKQSFRQPSSITDDLQLPTSIADLLAV